MDFPYDSFGYPIIDIELINDVNSCADINDEYNLFDYSNGVNRTISFQYLHDLVNEDLWQKLFTIVEKVNSVIIIDDIIIKNDEVKCMKDFYLKVYYYNLKKHNNKTYIYSDFYK